MVPLEVGNVATFNAMAYAPANPITVQFLENRIMEKVQSFGNLITDFGRSFVNSATEAFNAFHGSDAMRAAEAALRKSKTYFQANTIRPLTNLEQLQTAPDKMLRFLMAEPETLQLFREQRIDGYDGRFVDMNPSDKPGYGHYDYNRVVEGMFMDDEENDFRLHYSFDVLKEGDAELPHTQQVDILSAMDLMKQYRAHQRSDGTSVYDNKL